MDMVANFCDGWPVAASDVSSEDWHMTKDEMHTAILQLGKAARLEANRLDEAFLKEADPRAVEGGHHDHEAAGWRKLARALTAAADQCSNIED